MTTPSTLINVCHVDFSNDYQHVVYFNTGDEQVNYFTSRIVKTFTDYTHIRKNWTLKVGAHIAQAEKWNYLFFTQNNKRYFYFITNVKYISDETVELTLEMDVMQTYMFDYVLKACFVEREHSKTDNPGDNTIDEGLELGVYVDGEKSTPNAFNKKALMVMSTKGLGGGDCKRTIRDGIYTGCEVWRCNISSDADLNYLNQMFTALDDEGLSESIISMWMYLSDLVEVTGEQDGVPIALVSESKSAGYEYNIPWICNTLVGYKPKNNKLLTYPYAYIYATDNKGTTAMYRYEYFASREQPVFRIEGSIYPDGGLKVTPVNYKGSGFNYDEALTFTGFPTCPWTTDTYKLWLAQNQNQLAVSGITAGTSSLAGVGMMVAGAYTANPMLMASGGAMAYGGVMNIAQTVAKAEDMQKQPPQSRGSTSSTLNAALDLYVTFHNRTITKERAQIIDDYFTMFGYKTLRVKTPNRNVRKAFTYTKTRNCFISGEICQDDIRKIQSIYDNGVTFWNKDASIGNYTVDNSII